MTSTSKSASAALSSARLAMARLGTIRMCTGYAGWGWWNANRDGVSHSLWTGMAKLICVSIQGRNAWTRRGKRRSIRKVRLAARRFSKGCSQEIDQPGAKLGRLGALDDQVIRLVKAHEIAQRGCHIADQHIVRLDTLLQV